MKENKYLSKEYTNSLKGICAILVVIHHIYQYIGLSSNYLIIIVLQLIGFLSVAIFFFLSGYGLMYSSNKKDYIKNFFIKKILPFYLFCILLINLYCFVTLLLEKEYSPQKLIQSFFFGSTIITNGWYLQAILVIYILYFIIFKLIKSDKKRILAFGICIAIYCLICHFIGLGINWYQTIPCVVLGMIVCKNKDRLDKCLNKNSWLIFIFSTVLFILSYAISAVTNIAVFFNMLYSLFFVFAMVAFSYIICNTKLISNRLTSLCGDYSLEIYVSHGFFLKLYKLKYITNPVVFIFIVIIGTVVVSFILKKVYKKIYNLFK